jgi:hypothetical protein
MKPSRVPLVLTVAAVASLALQPPSEFNKAQKLQFDRLPDNPKLTGRFVPGGREGPAFATTDGKLFLLDPKTKIDKLPSVLVELLATKEDDRLRVTEWKPQLVAEWKDEAKKFPVSEYAELHTAQDELKKIAEEMNLRAMGPGAAQEFAGALKKVSDVTLAAYSKIPPEQRKSPQAKSLCQQHDKAQQAYKKAIYGRLDQYRPEVYKRIFESAGSAVAVAVRRAAWDPRGSGVLIGDNLVLTCAHVIDGYGPNELQVWFDFKPGDGRYTPVEAFSVVSIPFQGKAPRDGLPPLDFALLEIKPVAEGQDAKAARPPRPTLSTHRVRRDDAIYVVGHPDRKPRTVHDHSFVLFPFLATQDEYTALQMFVCAETQNSPDRAAELDLFIKSYAFNGPKKMYEYYSGRWKCPTISADCDTFQGNSGSGTFDRAESKLIGVVIGGSLDGGSRSLSPGWRHHEDILPITAVVEQLNDGLKGWQQKYNVKVE